MKPLLFLAVLSTLFACGSNKPAPTNPSIPTATSSGWFCQVGLSDEEWECVQDAALAAAPKPTRRPKATFPRTAEIAPSITASPAATEPVSQVATIPAEVSPSTQVSPVVDTVVLPQQGIAQPGEPQPRTELPRHVKLSYRPKEPVAILDLPTDFFAVQLVAVSSKATLQSFAKKHKIRGMSAARVWNGEKLYYVLLLGIYETKAKATASIESLAPPFDDMNPWIRNLGSLQRAMLDADREAGTTDI